MTRPPAATDSPATDFAVLLLSRLVAGGMREVVVCPGSRSQALALAAAALTRAGGLRVHVRIDERVAGFTALGLAVEAAAPVGVIVTSGTAVANLHPAALEAHHSGVPLVLLTADRPDELRGIGSNQTTEQRGVFGPLLPTLAVDAPTGEPSEADAAGRLAADVLARSVCGPVHVNLSFREPLSSGRMPPVESVEPPLARFERSERSDGIRTAAEPGTVVVAGHAAGARAEELARELGAPLLAEVSSGARFGPNLVPAYRSLLGEPGFGDAVRRVVVLGHPTLTREVPALLRRDALESIVVDARGVEPYDPGRSARIVPALRVDGTPDPSWERPWVGRWTHASRRVLQPDERSTVGMSQAEFARHELAAVRAPLTRRSLVAAVWAATWPHDRLVLGASRLIRIADDTVPGKRIRVHANRGLAGIDGTVSTAAGIALAAETAAEVPGTTRVLLGDLALLHDAGGLLLGDGEPRPRLQVVVGNDHGGTIFDTLEVAASADPDAFRRVFRTPQQVDLAALAAAYGWGYRAPTTQGELEQALTAPTGPELIEVVLPSSPIE